MVKNSILKIHKVLVAILCLILIISLSLNIYLYEQNSNIVQKYNDVANRDMSNSENLFFSALTNNGSCKSVSSILDYIKDPNNLSYVIEGIQVSENYYQTAAAYSAEQNINYNESLMLISLYLQELKSYRGYLINNDIKSYSYNINQIVGDLKIISDWLIERSNNNDFTVYTDKDFFNNVYDKLECSFKEIFENIVN